MLCILLRHISFSRPTEQSCSVFATLLTHENRTSPSYCHRLCSLGAAHHTAWSLVITTLGLRSPTMDREIRDDKRSISCVMCADEDVMHSDDLAWIYPASRHFQDMMQVVKITCITFVVIIKAVYLLRFTTVHTLIARAPSHRLLLPHLPSCRYCPSHPVLQRSPTKSHSGSSRILLGQSLH